MYSVKLLIFLASLTAIAQSVDVRFGTSNVFLRANVNRVEKVVNFSIRREGFAEQIVEIGNNFGVSPTIINELDGSYVIRGNGPQVRFRLVNSNDRFALIHVTRNGTKNDLISDCVHLNSERKSWFGGPQQKKQYWPIEKSTYSKYSYVTKEADNCAIAERYWVNSEGIFFYINEEAPLFIDQNVNGNKLCFLVEKKLPYYTHDEAFTFSYYIGIGKDAKQVHMEAITRFLGKPRGHPDERMVKHPVWSTWARYKRDITDETVMEFASDVLRYGFKNSQVEIDDDWEVCYGALTFRESKFPNIKELTTKLKEAGFKVTLWIHPFINNDCEPWYSEALANGYLVTSQQASTETQWWNSDKGKATYIDFTKPTAATWFQNRLSKLLEDTGIDSYKFDAGESSWGPPDPILNAPTDVHPMALTTDYIRTVSRFGPFVEVRSGMKNQIEPIFMRIVDKDSDWSWNNGLPTLVTSLLVLNMAGYPLVLPDMIGGNNYNDEPPNSELFIRWLQANVFMPSLQFSFVPWDYPYATIELSRKFVDLHAEYGDEIMKRFKLAVQTGEPVNPPLWWIAPNDRTAQQIDDQFLLGDDIIVAPVLVEGQTSRHIYLPGGKWLDKGGVNGFIHQGPKWLMDYPAPIEILPYFVRVK